MSNVVHVVHLLDVVMHRGLLSRRTSVSGSADLMFSPRSSTFD